MVDTVISAIKMLPKIVILCVAVVVAKASEGEYIVTHAPSHVTFMKEAEKVLVSDIPNVITTTFGFSPKKDLHWNGLGQTSLFARPKANVVISVDGAPRKLNVKSQAKFEANNDDPVLRTSSIVKTLESKVAAQPLIIDFSLENTLFDMKAAHAGLLDKLPSTLAQVENAFRSGDTSFTLADIGSLNFSHESDLMFLGELHIIRGVIDALKTNPQLAQDGVPDFYHFRVTSLLRLIEKHGKASQQIRDAMNLLEKVLDELTVELRKLYSDNLIVQVVTSRYDDSDRPLVRKTRSLLQDKAAADNKKEVKAAADDDIEKRIGLHAPYDSEYEVVFNIILWGGILYVIVIFSISYGIWVMDPGSDSIIYRMTSQRMKKD